MRYELFMECRGGGRHALQTLMIIKLKDGSFRLQQRCVNCKTFKYPHWGPNGKILGTATYKHSQIYREFLNSHDPTEARLEILASDIKKVEAPTDGSYSSVLRQVPRPKKGRGRTLTPKRARDKRRAAARSVRRAR